MASKLESLAASRITSPSTPSTGHRRALAVRVGRLDRDEGDGELEIVGLFD